MDETLHALYADLKVKPNNNFAPARLVLRSLLRDTNANVYIFLRLARFFHRKKYWRISRWMSHRLRNRFGCFISPKAEIGPGLHLPHPTGVIIGEKVRMGKQCTIYQQVTIGGARSGDYKAGRQPQIGDGVTIFAGAKVLGAITIGDDAVIGANAVVIKDVPAGHIAVGNPASCRPPAAREVPKAMAG